MQSLQLVSSDENLRNTAIASQRLLDDARASAMENLLCGGLLSQSIEQLCVSLSKVLGSCHTQLVSYNGQSQTFNCIEKQNSAHSELVSQFVNQQLNQADSDIQQQLLDNQELIFSDIYQSRSWKPFHVQSRELGLVAAWVIPVWSQNLSLNGAFVCLFNTRRQADDNELSLIHRAANTAGAILFHGKRKTVDLKQKVGLQKQLLRQQEDLEENNQALKKAINQRVDVQKQLIEMENLAALGTMMSSLTHEINTPIGVSITASSYLTELQESCLEKFENNQLRKSELQHYIKESHEAAFIIQRNVTRADELIRTFKRLSVDQDSQNTRNFNLGEYLCEVLLSLKPKLKHTPHKFCFDIPSDLTLLSNPGAISQVFINLIMNSINHAFLPNTQGRITIKAETDNASQSTVITYKDNGVGMNAETLKDMYKPFFSLSHKNDSSGLGLHICQSIVMKVLKGSLTCQSESGKGTEFTIVIPA